MAGLCEQAGSKGYVFPMSKTSLFSLRNFADGGAFMYRDILQAMKTPSRFQSVRKLNSIIDLKGIKVYFPFNFA